MRALVIGGTRFIGAHVVRQLYDRGAAVTVFHRGSSDNSILPDVEHVCDPCAAYPITGFPEALRQDWDVVVHMVGMGSADAQAAVRAFAGRAGRLLLVSSSDVYLAYGRLTKVEPGPAEPVPLSEDAPLRSTLFPYRGMESQLGEYARNYDKILAEQAVRVSADLEWTILRLPKVYGPEDNGDLATIYGFAAVSAWRWTHGHVQNVAAAIVACSEHAGARNTIFNVGEETTPSMGERLAMLPDRNARPPDPPLFDFDQPLVLDTARIRSVIGYREIVDERSAMLDLARGRAGGTP